MKPQISIVDMENRQADKLGDVIQYIVNNYSDDMLTRTKLVKLVFLADAEAEEYLGSKITDTEYMNYHYGPYSDRIIDTVKSLDGQTILEKSGMSSKGKFYQYESVSDPPEPDLTSAQQTIIQNIIDNWEGDDTETMVQRVYDRYDIEEKPKYATIL